MLKWKSPVFLTRSVCCDDTMFVIIVTVRENDYETIRIDHNGVGIILLNLPGVDTCSWAWDEVCCACAACILVSVVLVVFFWQKTGLLVGCGTGCTARNVWCSGKTQTRWLLSNRCQQSVTWWQSELWNFDRRRWRQWQHGMYSHRYHRNVPHCCPLLAQTDNTLSKHFVGYVCSCVIMPVPGQTWFLTL